MKGRCLLGIRCLSSVCRGTCLSCVARAGPIPLNERSRQSALDAITVDVKYAIRLRVCWECTLKDVELRLIGELSRNSRRSDRELARALHVSQPTVTRIRSRLEKEGIIREYTIVPDFIRLGYEMVSITFAKMAEAPSQETIAEIMKKAKEMEKKNPSPTIVSMRGIGCEADYVSVAFHRNYSEYTEYAKYIRQFPHVKVDEIKSFVIDLNDQSHFRYLTLTIFADYLSRTKESP
jgi:DNA-binding Lrp family transcriptional regulator